MKKLVLSLLLFPTCAFCSFSSYRFTEEKDEEYSHQAEIIFDGTISLEKWQFQDKDGFKIDLQYPEKVDSKKYSKTLELLTYGLNPNARVANYLVSFKAAKFTKGNEDTVKDLKWNYQNSYRSMCPHHPNELIHGARFRFYIIKTQGEDQKRVTSIKYLILPGGAKQSSANQATPAIEPKPEVTKSPEK